MRKNIKCKICGSYKKVPMWLGEESIRNELCSTCTFLKTGVTCLGKEPIYQWLLVKKYIEITVRYQHYSVGEMLQRVLDYKPSKNVEKDYCHNLEKHQEFFKGISNPKMDEKKDTEGTQLIDRQMKSRNTKSGIGKGIQTMASKAMTKGYLFLPLDIFALGYMFGKYGLKDWSQEELMRGCKEYDKKDDLGLLDTIGETLIDLGLLDNSKKEI